MLNHHFISYSLADASDFALKLCDELRAGPPPISAWLDKRDIKPGQDWDDEIVEAIRTCDSLIFVMTQDSIESESGCKNEWTRAMKYIKSITPILLHEGVEMPFQLGNRQYIDFTGEFDTGLANLRNHIKSLNQPKAKLKSLKDRLADARRDLRRTEDSVKQARIEDDIESLKQQIAEKQQLIDDPKGAKKRQEESIKARMEDERIPQRAVSGVSLTKFINSPPAAAPIYFQDRSDEINRIGDFLKDDATRLISIVGCAGMGKTAMVCRLLKSFESGELLVGGVKLPVDGIVYLDKTRLKLPHMYTDLCKLLPDDIAQKLEQIYKNPKSSTEDKMRALLKAFSHGRVVVLMDNFEDVMGYENSSIQDTELYDALSQLLNLPHHAINVILTTRIAPSDLLLVQPGRQNRIDLADGLLSPYAENILREMDADGKVVYRDVHKFINSLPGRP